MLCSISGHVPQDPVVSIKTGHIFERRLIEDYIKLHGKCPITGVELTENDIIPLKVANASVTPRQTTATSIPGMLQIFQNEWDACMLENFELHQQLSALRQELTQTLYQHDAACRVIARLTKERDEAKQLLAQQQAIAGKTAGAAANGDVEMGDDTARAIEKIERTARALTGQRKKRDLSGVLKESDVAAFAELASYPLHGAAAPGITSCDIFEKKQNLIVTGGVDGEVCVFDTKDGKISATLSGHTKRITQVVAHKTRDIVVSASSDKTVRVWNDDGNSYSCAHTLRHDGAVSGIALHPCGDYLLSAIDGGKWNFWDIATGKSIFETATPAQSGYNCASIHVDGALFGVGSADGKLSIWDFKTHDHPVWETAVSHITSLAFSENGFFMATGTTDSTVLLWDLRKMQNFHTIALNNGAAVNGVSFDNSGKFLSVASKDVAVYYGKTFTPVKLFNQHTQPVMCTKFGNDAKFLASVSMDRTLKLYGQK